MGLIYYMKRYGESYRMKIHMIGCSGSGKSYLANFFSEKYEIPHYDLDDIFWENTPNFSYGAKRSCGTRKIVWKIGYIFQTEERL